MNTDTSCVVKVGDGRGFIIEHRTKVLRSVFPRRLAKNLIRFRKFHLVVAAAHCLPKFPPPYSASHATWRTYKALLGSLDGSKTGVWAELLFADPVADIAVLGCPDGQDFFDEAEAYDALTNEAPALEVRQARNGTGWILSLDGHWVRTELKVKKGLHGISLQTGPTDAGMPGSPILNDNGRAVGVVVIGTETVHQATGAGEGESWAATYPHTQPSRLALAAR